MLQSPDLSRFSGSFLSDSAAETLYEPVWRPQASAEAEGRIGSYRLLDVLGKGGMGLVYLAEQKEPVERRVAIKVIAHAYLDDEARLRFAAERQALARLEHPNVARLYEAGTMPEGAPFFVMELVDGKPITDWSNERGLGMRQRLELFRAVCAGVHHAHQKGLIHRDLKPANILVAELEGRAVPKIIDFGVAKAIDQPLVEGMHTTTGAIIGTPRYLAPEAFGGLSSADLDIRADVYSLGVVLFELLAGAHPFEAQNRSLADFILECANADRPTPSDRFAALDAQSQGQAAAARGLSPAMLHQELRGDLDWIVKRAIAVERDQRYASVAELGAEIGRVLADEPVLAGPPSRTYRLRKLVRRHRAVVAAATFALISLVFGVVASTLEARRANREARAAERARQESDQTVEFLVDVFSIADPTEQRGRLVTAREVLERGAEHLEKSALEDSPGVRARLLATIARAESGLGLNRDALRHAQGALDLRQSLHGPDHLEVARSVLQVSDLHFELGQIDATKLLHQRFDQLLQTLAIEDPELLARRSQNAGALAYREARFDEAEGHFRSAAELFAAAGSARQHEQALMIGNLALVRAKQNLIDEAIELHRRELSLLEDAGGESSDLARALLNLAATLMSRNRIGEAEPLLVRALAIRERLLEPNHPGIARIHLNLAKAKKSSCRLDEARAHVERALAIRLAAFGPDHPDLGHSYAELGDLAELQGRNDEAELQHRRALAVWENHFGPDHPNVAFPLASLGLLARKRGSLSTAEKLLRRSVKILAEEDEVDRAWAEWALGIVLADRGALAEAETLLRRAFEVRTRELPADDDEVHDSYEALVALLKKMGRKDEAAQLQQPLPRTHTACGSSA
jgi:eukaryotic-like serine/threonine-protein kinase